MRFDELPRRDLVEGNSGQKYDYCGEGEPGLHHWQVQDVNQKYVERDVNCRGAESPSQNSRPQALAL